MPAANPAEKWLSYHERGFTALARQCGTKDTKRASWFSRQADRCKATLRTLPRATSFCTDTPLFIDGAVPRCQDGEEQTPFRIYLALEADFQNKSLLRSSLKLGVIDPTAEKGKLIYRLMYDYDESKQDLNGQNTHTHDSFPYHVQWGKNPKELEEGDTKVTDKYDLGFDKRLDEPRLPSLPMDFFMLIQLVKDQFDVADENSATSFIELLRDASWNAVLHESTVMVARPWWMAMEKAYLKDRFTVHRTARQVSWVDLVKLH